MKEIIVDSKEKGQRFDKFLIKYFPKAGSGFVYKMLRKKNITLNDKKADGSERLSAGDCIKVYFSDDTFAKFHSAAEFQNTALDNNHDLFLKAYKKLGNIERLFESEDILVLNKPAGVLSQSTNNQEPSLNEWLIGYLLHNGCQLDFTRYKPSVCNRLDRNTSGIVLCAKTYAGSRYLSDQISRHNMQKYYFAVAEGCFRNPGKAEEFQEVKAWLYKNSEANKAAIYDDRNKIPDQIREGCHEIHTKFRVLQQSKKYALLEIQLITGKSHQIRAQLAHMGHPLAGDLKYGGHILAGHLLPDDLLKYTKNISVYTENKKGLNFQLLHAAKVVFPQTGADDLGMSGKIIECKPPIYYYELTGQDCVEENGRISR